MWKIITEDPQYDNYYYAEEYGDYYNNYNDNYEEVYNYEDGDERNYSVFTSWIHSDYQPMYLPDY